MRRSLSCHELQHFFLFYNRQGVEKKLYWILCRTFLLSLVCVFQAETDATLSYLEEKEEKLTARVNQLKQKRPAHVDCVQRKRPDGVDTQIHVTIDG